MAQICRPQDIQIRARAQNWKSDYMIISLHYIKYFEKNLDIGNNPHIIYLYKHAARSNCETGSMCIITQKSNR